MVWLSRSKYSFPKDFPYKNTHQWYDFCLSWDYLYHAENDTEFIYTCRKSLNRMVGGMP